MQKFFLYQSKYYVKIASDFEPASWRKISARQRAKNSEFVWENQRESLGRALRAPPFLFPKKKKENKHPDSPPLPPPPALPVWGKKLGAPRPQKIFDFVGKNRGNSWGRAPRAPHFGFQK